MRIGYATVAALCLGIFVCGADSPGQTLEHLPGMGDRSLSEEQQVAIAAMSRDQLVSLVRTGDAAHARCALERCLELTNPTQLLWAQAQMGLASTGVMRRDLESAVHRYDLILDIDVSRVVLPDWKVWPDGSNRRGKARLEIERTRLRQSVQRIQKRALEKKLYVLKRNRT